MLKPHRVILALAILLAMLGDSSAAPRSQDKAPPPQQPAATDQRGTDQVPLTVKVQPKSEAQTTYEKWEYEKKPTIEEGLTSYTWYLALFTFLLFCAVVVQAGLFVWQLLLIKEAAGITKGAADAARLNAQAVIDAERAHLYVIIKVHNVSDLISASGGAKYSDKIAKDKIDPPTLAYVLKNYGKTPAILEGVLYCVSIQETEGGPRTYRAPERALEILGANEETEAIAVAFEDRQFIVDDAKSLGDHDTMLFFYSQATFMDAFNRRHTIDSDFLYSAGRFHLIGRRETSEDYQATAPERPPRTGFFGRPTDIG